MRDRKIGYVSNFDQGSHSKYEMIRFYVSHLHLTSILESLKDKAMSIPRSPTNVQDVRKIKYIADSPPTHMIERSK